jgi:RNA ligase (TIGR02306 family)
MSTFEVLVYKIDKIEKHPNADRIELVRIEGFTTIQPIGKYTKGDLVAYIPEDSIVPSSILEELGLADKIKSRIRQVKFRDVYSEGLIYPAREDWELGQNVAEELGIVKHQVEMPVHLRGAIQSNKLPGLPRNKDRTIPFDVENLRKNMGGLEGSQVEITEKIHGTNIQIGIFPEPKLSLWRNIWNFVTRKKIDPFERHTVTSKGLAKEGQVRKLVLNKDGVATDTYWKMALASGVFSESCIKAAMLQSNNQPLFLIGEVFGPGIQKGFTYGDKLQMRIFDVYLGSRKDGYYLAPKMARAVLISLRDAGADLEYVPILYSGPWDEAKAFELSEGLETISGKGMHIREGIVISHKGFSNKLKLVSDTYKFRNIKDGGTDYE